MVLFLTTQYMPHAHVNSYIISGIMHKFPAMLDELANGISQGS